jgi:hypothetical protein
MTKEQAYQATIRAKECKKQREYEQVLHQIKLRVDMGHFTTTYEFNYPENTIPKLQELGYEIWKQIGNHYHINWGDAFEQTNITG